MWLDVLSHCFCCLATVMFLLACYKRIFYSGSQNLELHKYFGAPHYMFFSHFNRVHPDEMWHKWLIF